MKRIVIIVLAVFIANIASAQKKAKDTTLFTFGTNKVTLKEFEHGFTKNEKPGVKHSAKDVDDYLDLYKKFKLKVQDAYDQGIDTTDGFKSELSGYRKQIAKPYLTDKVVNEQLVQEAYERMGIEVHSSHILLFISPDAAPEDTLKAFTRLNEIRNDLMSGKLTFDNAAETFSEDPSAKDNKGDLGFNTAFQLVYEFENHAYNTPVGQISKVFRTQFGYHILKVIEKRPSKGEMTVKHIMIQTNPNPGSDEVAEAKAKIDEVYKKLQAGDKFEMLVQQYSEDASSLTANGELPAFNMTNMRLPEQFKVAAFGLLNDGDYTRPVQTPSGFHIIKRVSLKPLPPLKDIRNTILNKISRDSRQYRNTLAVYNKALAFYKVKDNPKNLAAYQSEIDSSLLKGTYAFKNYKLTEAKFAKLAAQPLFVLSTKKKAFSVEDFGKFLTNVEKPSESKNLESIIASAYKDFKIQSIMDYYENDLENNNDTFAALYKEYKEGILLFTLTDKKVWTKSVEDTVGLKNFYAQNSDKYTFQNRYDATIIRCSDKKVADAVKKDLEANLSLDSIQRKNNKLNPLNMANPISGKFEKGDNNYANMLFETDKTDTKYLIFEDMKAPGGYVLIQVHHFIPSGKKTLNEARGPITSDYQNYLEKEWLETLMKKYPIIVNQPAYDIFKKQNDPLMPYPSCRNIILVFTIALALGCKQQGKVKSDDILAEVGTKTLLKKDIPEQYWNKLLESDSSGLLKLYIDRWVDNQLMLQEAENNLSDAAKDKSKLIEDYRTSLLIFEYQQKLIKEKLDTGVTEKDIETFYLNNRANFQLKKNIVKIRYVKIDKRNPNVSKVQKLMQNPGAVNDSLLRLLAEKEAVNFYVDDNWLFLDDIIKEIPLDENYNQQRFLSNNKFISIEENGTLYLLYMIDYRIKNTDSPFEFEKDKIKDILLYQRKLDFLKSTQRTLLDKALKSGNVKIYPYNH